MAHDASMGLGADWAVARPRARIPTRSVHSSGCVAQGKSARRACHARKPGERGIVKRPARVGLLSAADAADRRLPKRPARASVFRGSRLVRDYHLARTAAGFLSRPGRRGNGFPPIWVREGIHAPAVVAAHLSFPSVCPGAPGWRLTATRFVGCRGAVGVLPAGWVRGTPLWWVACSRSSQREDAYASRRNHATRRHQARQR